MSDHADPGTPHPLAAIGFSGRWPALLAAFDPATPGRVIRVDRGAATVLTADGDQSTSQPTTRRVSWHPDLGMPVTGDWVAVDGDVLVGIADRTTAITRPITHGQRSSNEGDQVLATNMDVVGVVVAADRDVNVRRLERGVVMAYESGALPMVLLTKIDLADPPEVALRHARAAAPGVDVIALSALTGEGVAEVRAALEPDRTIALLGVSGAGKSTLTNALVGEDLMGVQAIRSADGRGRHTTTHRELIPLPAGGAVLDTPGLRAFGLGVVDDGLELAFPEIDELAAGCRFGDCRHEHEPGCAVLAALDGGELDADRWEGFVRIRAASENAALRADTAAWRREARSWGRVYREAQAMKQREG